MVPRAIIIWRKFLIKIPKEVILKKLLSSDSMGVSWAIGLKGWPVGVKDVKAGNGADGFNNGVGKNQDD